MFIHSRLKQTLVLIVTLSMLITLAPMAALADADISIDLTTATLDELQNAQAMIEARIDELTQQQATSAPTDESEVLHYEGTGTAIISDLQLPYEYNQILYTTDNMDTTYKLVAVDSNETLSFTRIGLPERDVVGGNHNCKLLVEGEGNWSMDIKPIELDDMSDTIDFTGVGSAITPVFILDTDKILSLHVKAPDGQGNRLTFVHMYMYALTGDGELRKDIVLTGGQLDDSNAGVKDFILSPVKDATGYVLALTCEPDHEWTMTAQ